MSTRTGQLAAAFAFFPILRLSFFFHQSPENNWNVILKNQINNPKWIYVHTDTHRGGRWWWRRRSDLANEGAVRLDPGVAPRDHPEIDDGDEVALEDLHQITHYEIRTVRTQSFIVKRDGDFVGGTRICWGSERNQDVRQNKNGEKSSTSSHLLWVSCPSVGLRTVKRFSWGNSPWINTKRLEFACAAAATNVTVATGKSDALLNFLFIRCVIDFPTFSFFSNTFCIFHRTGDEVRPKDGVTSTYPKSLAFKAAEPELLHKLLYSAFFFPC